MKNINFDVVIKALLDATKPFPPAYLHRLSGLNQVELTQLNSIWTNIDVERRVALLEDLEDLSEKDPLLNFDEIGFFCMKDNDPRARSAALRLLWEYEGRNLLPELINMLHTDASDLVRATAASNLGRFVYQGDMGDLQETVFTDLLNNLLEVLNSQEKPIVRRRALESLAFHNREDIKSHLLDAYKSGSSEWVSSALFGMGRSANIRWEKLVLNKLNSEDTENRLEAIKATGELELKSAREALLETLDDELDEELRFAIMWSLSKIGGEGVKQALQRLHENTEDDEESEFIESALENLEFTESLTLPDLFDAEEFDEDDFYQIIDLEKDSVDNDINEDNQLPPSQIIRK